MLSAVGGTRGPPTSHMVTVARSRSIHGPWEDCPFNPIVRTHERRRAVVVARPCHGGRGAGGRLVDGLPRLRERLPHARPPDAARAGRVDRRRLAARQRRHAGAAAAQAARRPAQPGGAGAAATTSRRTASARSGRSSAPTATRLDRARLEGGRLVLRAKGTSLADCSPLRVHGGRPALRGRGRARGRRGRAGRPGAVLRRPRPCRPGLRRRDDAHPPLRRGAGLGAREGSRRAATGSGCATSRTTSPSTTRWTTARGSCRTGSARSRATTTTCSAASCPAHRAVRDRQRRGALAALPLPRAAGLRAAAAIFIRTTTR